MNVVGSSPITILRVVSSSVIGLPGSFSTSSTIGEISVLVSSTAARVATHSANVIISVSVTGSAPVF